MEKINRKNLPEYSRKFLSHFSTFTDFTLDTEYVKWILQFDCWLNGNVDIDRVKVELLPFILGNNEKDLS